MESQNGTNPSSSALHDRLDAITANLKSVVEQLSSGAASLKSNASSRVSSFAKKAETLVKDHPIASLAAAFGIGYIAMRLFRR